MKAKLRDELAARLAAQLASARAAHAAAIEGAFHEEAKPENDKDTRGLEQSYLARGVAQRVVDLENGHAAVLALTIKPLARVALGALVTLDEDGEESQLYVAPAGGGEVIDRVQVVTPASPLGKALLGKVVDDEAEVKLPGKTRTLLVVAIA